MNKLFIVEDEAIIRKGLVSSIQWENWGFAVCGEAVNGRKALDYIMQNDVDVIMTDVRMPVMDGLELARLVKAAKPDVKIVVLTGFSDFEYARQSLEYGVFQYILKPLKREKLAEVFLQLRELLDKEQREREEKNALLQAVAESRSILLQKQLSDWVHGRSVNKLNMEAFTGASQGEISYVCAVVDIDNLGSYESKLESGFNKEAWLHMQDAISQASHPLDGDATLSGVDDQGRLVLLVQMGDGEMAEAEALDRVAKSLGTLLDLLPAVWNGASFSAGIGGLVKEAERVPVSYRQASEALDYRFYSGPTSMNMIHDVPPLVGLTPQQFQFIKQAEKRLMTYISLGSGDLDLIFEDMFAEIAEQRNIPYTTVKHAAAQTLYSVCGYVSEQGSEWEMNIMDDIAMTALTDLEHILSFAKRKIKEIKDEIDRADPGAGRNLVRQAKEYVGEHYMNDIVLADIAARLYVNPSYFSWLFKQETGLTFTTYLSQIRMDQAKVLLKQDKQKVYEVGQSVGYNDYRHFCKMFKKIEGISPKEFKQRGK
ncbi:response regulator [Paenibacillus mendelii]|uniref:Response regulator n=1 Tax=Paenibacillus mendelii TaxID=206163 RepID=A0ABV6JL71_9BACL|nr:response regulator [Paenibacillus mendelii]MCQ6562316.1 response regulator [Paenibacillus mendelii]